MAVWTQLSSAEALQSSRARTQCVEDHTAGE